MADCVVRVADLPNAENETFLEASFFAQSGAVLPSPQEVRDRQIRDQTISETRPPPVRFPHLHLIVKYGGEVTIAEGQCLWYLRRHLTGSVPVPEVFAWRRDCGETFIYMSFEEGSTLEDRWHSLKDHEKASVCEQLQSIVSSWRGLKQETEPFFVGHIGGQGLLDIMLWERNMDSVGPFANITGFHDWLSRLAAPSHPEWDPRHEWPEMAGMTDGRSVVFTHGDLHPSNILLTTAKTPDPVRVLAIIDWHQSGWYPEDWEALKARWTVPRDEWSERYLPLCLEIRDKDYATAFEFMSQSWI